MNLEDIAKYAFMAFAIIALIAGLAVGYMAYDKHPLGFADPDVSDIHGYIMLVMMVLGIIVGLVSITAKEVSAFLLAAIALIVTGTGISVWAPLLLVEALQWLYYMATAILTYFVAFAAPAAVIIAAKSIWAIAKEK